MPDERRAIHAYLTAESHDTWHRVAEESGVSLSGLLEALAADMSAHAPDSGGHGRWSDVVRDARRIDAQRRRRSRT
jgi:hypothetical protein